MISYYSAGNQCYHKKVLSKVNLVMSPVVNRHISLQEMRAVAIKHLIKLSVEHDFLPIFILREKRHDPFKTR